ncbi:MAG: polymerase sigma-70 factor, subfamily [Pyrinomonadaceae bacterium]|jgi:RNA polymerase sigma-70 factor (ECF subfamily)|nr:polymerase sigma-70 factor, subfamily [Pyrinomonadaceae bacterium]
MAAHTDSSDRELLQSLQAGDEGALSELYRRSQQSVYRFAFQMCGSQTVAEDVTQEVFMVLLKEGHSFDPARGSLNAFLIGVARNHVLRRQRRERFYVAMSEEAQSGQDSGQTTLLVAGPLDELSRRERIETIRRAVLALPEKYREVVVLCDLEELPYVEAAEILQCAVGTVRSRLHRARALLLEKLRLVHEPESAPVTTRSARCFA